MAARLLSGSVTPNGNVFGDPGDVYADTSGGAGATFWLKESGVGTDTGWTAISSAELCQNFLYIATGGEGTDFRVALPAPQPTPYAVYAQFEGIDAADTFLFDIPVADQTAVDFRVLARNDGSVTRGDRFAFQVCPLTAPVPGPPPVITGATQVPLEGTFVFTYPITVQGGDQLLLQGAGFLSATSAHVNGVATPFTIIDDNNINLGPMPVQPSGACSITVSNANGTSGAFNAVTYNHWRTLAPQGVVNTTDLARGVGGQSILLGTGKILLFGGDTSTGSNLPPLNPGRTVNSYLFDPLTLTYVQTGNMNVARDAVCACKLADGRVLCVGNNGGSIFSGTANTTGEVYDPGTGTWTLVSNQLTPNGRFLPFFAVLLPTTNQVLIGGGDNVNSASWQLYDPGTNSFINHAANNTQALEQPAIAIAGGDVICLGAESAIVRVMRYSPGTNSWTQKAVPLHATVGARPSWAPLPSGKIMQLGVDPGIIPREGTTDVDIYDPVADTWAAGPPCSQSSISPPLAVLSTGKILRSRGYFEDNGNPSATFPTEVFTEGVGWAALDQELMNPQGPSGVQNDGTGGSNSGYLAPMVVAGDVVLILGGPCHRFGTSVTSVVAQYRP